MDKFIAQFDFEPISKDSDRVRSKCNSIMFDNRGNVDGLIDGVFPIKAGDAPLVLGNEHEGHIEQTFRITFPIPAAGFPGGAIPLIIVSRKYVKIIKK